MKRVRVVWDKENDKEGNLAYVNSVGISPRDVEEILMNGKNLTFIDALQETQITFGYTTCGKILAVVWEHVMEDLSTLRPIIAYEPREPLVSTHDEQIPSAEIELLLGKSRQRQTNS